MNFSSASVSDRRAQSSSAQAQAPSRSRADQIVAALRGTSVPSPQTSAGYRLAIGSLAVALLVISIAFGAMLVFLVWLVGWHVFQAIVTLSIGPYFIFHVPMALLGGLLLLFMFKPLFFRDKDLYSDVLILQKQHEPALFAFVEQMCQATGAPMPARIEVTCEPNAGARRMGMFSSRKKLALQIGLPLAAALPAREFAGVLAHELGHFNQRAGMTGSHLVRRLIGFFAQIVFQRDRLDYKLDRLWQSRHGGKRFLYWILWLPTESARGVLWLMLIAGELLACGAMRRMEFSADESEAHVAGTKSFVRTGKLLIFLSIAGRRARMELANAWEQRRLADDLPALIVGHARQLAEHRKDILKTLEEQETRWFDTHPCHNDRVKNVDRLAAPGQVKCDVSAKHLFADFESVCRKATVAHYRKVLGAKFAEAKLVPTASLVAEGLSQREAFKTLRRYLRGVVVPLRPIFPSVNAGMPPTKPRETAAALNEARARMLRAANAAAKDCEGFEKNAVAIAIASAQLSLCKLPGGHSLRRLRNRVEGRLPSLQQEERTLAQTLSLFEEPARQRLTSGLQLLQSDEMARTLDPKETSALQYESLRLMDTAWALETHVATVRSLREQTVKLRVLDSAVDANRPYPPLVEQVWATSKQILQTIKQLTSGLSTVAYPFDHAVQGVSVGDALVQRVPENFKELGEVHDCAVTTADRFETLTFRTLSRLSEHAERVETALKIEPLPDPEVKPSKEEKDAEEAEAKQRARATRAYWVGYGARAAGGLAMLTLLVWLSLSPPTVPAMPWNDSSGSHQSYRPSAFHPSLDRSYYQAPAPVQRPSYSPTPAYQQQPQGIQPQTPGTIPNPNAPQNTRPGTPPGYQPPQNPRPGSPPNYNPPTSPRNPQPSAPRSPGYNPAPSAPRGPFGGGAPGGGAPSPGRR